MKAINFAGGWRARVSCRGLQPDVDSFKTKLGAHAMVKPVHDDDREQEQTVPWNELVISVLCFVWCLDCPGMMDSLIVDI